MTEPLSSLPPAQSGKNDLPAELQFLDKLADKGINGATQASAKKIFDEIEKLFPKLDFSQRLRVIERLDKIANWAKPGLLEKVSNFIFGSSSKSVNENQISAAAAQAIENISRNSRNRENVEIASDVEPAWHYYTKSNKKNGDDLVRLFKKIIGTYESESQLAFMAAVSSGNYAEVKRMILLKTIDVNAITSGHTPLRKAHLYKDEEMIKILMSAKDIDPKKRDAWGCLPEDPEPPPRRAKKIGNQEALAYYVPKVDNWKTRVKDHPFWKEEQEAPEISDFIGKKFADLPFTGHDDRGNPLVIPTPANVNLPEISGPDNANLPEVSNPENANTPEVNPDNVADSPEIDFDDESNWPKVDRDIE